MSDAVKVIAAESGDEDAFLRAAKTEPEPLKSRYVSSKTVAVGEGVRFRLKSFDWVPDQYPRKDNDGNVIGDGKVVEITGEVIECRAAGLVEDGNVIVSCRTRRLEQMANEVGATATVPGAVLTLVRGEDEGNATGWRWTIENPDEPLPVEPPEEDEAG